MSGISRRNREISMFSSKGIVERFRSLRNDSFWMNLYVCCESGEEGDSIEQRPTGSLLK